MWTLCFLIIAIPFYIFYQGYKGYKESERKRKYEEAMKPRREYELLQEVFAIKYQLTDREEAIIREDIIEGKYEETFKKLYANYSFLHKLHIDMLIKIQLIALQYDKLQKLNTHGFIYYANNSPYQKEFIEYVFLLHNEMRKHGMDEKLYVYHNNKYYVIGVNDIDTLYRQRDRQFYWRSAIPYIDIGKISTRPFVLRNY